MVVNVKSNKKCMYSAWFIVNNKYTVVILLLLLSLKSEKGLCSETIKSFLFPGLLRI